MAETKYGKKWSEDETILAFYYYCQIPFGKIHKTNPEIMHIASILGRTPSSVVLKMGNLGHFDPELQKRNVSGLSNASKTDKEVVTRFFDDWEELTFRAKTIEAALLNESVQEIVELPVGEDREHMVRTRVNQQFFRTAVLSSYRQCCCITGLNIAPLLIASHIKPWAVCKPGTERTNPRNGLCLNALHDKAFDKGLITVLPDFTVRVSSKVTSCVNSDGAAFLAKYDKQPITLPEKFAPNREYLEYHNDGVFSP